MDRFKIMFDKRMVVIDMLKYIGTLSFGAIVLLSGFLQYLRQLPYHGTALKLMGIM